MARPMIEVEAISLGEALEMAMFLRKVRREISGDVVNTVGRTDSKTLEMAIGSNTGVSNRRLRIDLAAIKQAIEVGDVKEIVWIEGGEQVADCLTREKERRVRLIGN